MGLLLLLFSVIYAGYSICDNHNATYTQAIIVSSKPSGYAYFENQNGTQKMYDEVTVQYLVEGRTYSGDMLKRPGEYRIGEEVEYCYDKENYHLFMPKRI